MKEGFLWLILGELCAFLVILVFKFISNYFETKKINSILDFFKNRMKEKELEEKYNQCLKIIKENSVRGSNKNG